MLRMIRPSAVITMRSIGLPVSPGGVITRCRLPGQVTCPADPPRSASRSAWCGGFRHSQTRTPIAPTRSACAKPASRACRVRSRQVRLGALLLKSALSGSARGRARIGRVADVGEHHSFDVALRGAIGERMQDVRL